MWPYSGIFWRWFEQQISVHFCTEITRKGWRRFIDNPHSVSGKSMLLQCSPVSELHKNYTNFFHYLPLMRHCAILIKIIKKIIILVENRLECLPSQLWEDQRLPVKRKKKTNKLKSSKNQFKINKQKNN